MQPINSPVIFAEKYRPKIIKDAVYSKNLLKKFRNILRKGIIPNMTFIGPAGTGKTTAAICLANQLDYDWIMINGSLDRNIDVIRNEITNFASTVSLVGNRKLVIIDEADYLNSKSTQPALRSFIEEYSNNCSFILTGNYEKKILSPLISRCPVLDFNIPSNEINILKKKFAKLLINIIKKEKIKIDSGSLKFILHKYFPDYRKIISVIQQMGDEISFSDINNIEEDNFDELMKYIRDKDYVSIRNWVQKNYISGEEFYRVFYNHLSNLIKSNSIPVVIILMSEYSYKSYFVADQEINISAFLAEIMIELDGKWK